MVYKILKLWVCPIRGTAFLTDVGNAPKLLREALSPPVFNTAPINDIFPKKMQQKQTIDVTETTAFIMSFDKMMKNVPKQMQMNSPVLDFRSVKP